MKLKLIFFLVMSAFVFSSLHAQSDFKIEPGDEDAPIGVYPADDKAGGDDDDKGKNLDCDDDGDGTVSPIEQETCWIGKVDEALNDPDCKSPPCILAFCVIRPWACFGGGDDDDDPEPEPGPEIPEGPGGEDEPGPVPGPDVPGGPGEDAPGPKGPVWDPFGPHGPNFDPPANNHSGSSSSAAPGFALQLEKKSIKKLRKFVNKRWKSKKWKRVYANDSYFYYVTATTPRGTDKPSHYNIYYTQELPKKGKRVPAVRYAMIMKKKKVYFYATTTE